MCGLAGIYAFGANSAAPLEDDVRRMAGTLVHRGPDADGFLVDGPAALGFRRLSVIDLHGGHQPIWNEDASAAVFQNGEIYNFHELRRQLQAKGHLFKTESDTEVIVHLYEDVGDDFPRHLRGMFAIALFDKRRQRLVLVRDRLGKKPLYYAVDDGRLLYASELKALLSMPTFSRCIDEHALLDYFTYRSVPGTRTIFRAARKLAPGHMLVADASGIGEPRPYWQLSFANPLDEPPERVALRLLDLIDESVRLRMLADVPVGAFLSGGVDSAAVVAAMVAAQPAAVRTFTVGFSNTAHDERARARATAEALGTCHTAVQLSLDPTAALDILPWYFDEPFADASAVPTYAVSSAARAHVTVALSGDGGDENFAGYDHHVYDARVGRLRRFVPSMLRPVLGSIAHAYPGQTCTGRRVRGKTTLTSLATEPVRAYFQIVRATDPAFVTRQFDGELRASLADYDPFDVMAQAYARTDAPDPLGRILQLDMATYLCDDILTKVDRASMAVSLEVRSPLLDHCLVEFAARIPTSFKLRNGKGKWILRKALLDRLPAPVLDAPKHGFDVPLRDWTRSELRAAIEEAVNDAPTLVFDRTALSHVWRNHLSGQADHTEFLWAVLIFDGWRRAHAIPLT